MAMGPRQLPAAGLAGAWLAAANNERALHPVGGHRREAPIPEKRTDQPNYVSSQLGAPPPPEFVWSIWASMALMASWPHPSTPPGEATAQPSAAFFSCRARGKSEGKSSWCMK